MIIKTSLKNIGLIFCVVVTIVLLALLMYLFFDGINPAGKRFPLKIASKDIIYAKAENVPWCYRSIKNCHPNYNAADIGVPEGTEVLAFGTGEVFFAGDSGKNGQAVSIKGDDGLWYYYTHLKMGSLKIRTGDKVKSGQILGQVGSGEEANNTISHLHFDISTDENLFDRPSNEASNYSLNVQPVLLWLFYLGLK